MRHIAATILFLCICVSGAQRLFQTAKTKVVPGLLKRQLSSACDNLPSTWTVCLGAISGCCETGSGSWQCCPVGCCPTSNSDHGTQWYCDSNSVTGCCFVNAELSTCSGTSFKNVTVSATDPRITYTPQWNLGTSTCDASQQSKKTVTTNQSLSFNTQGFSVGSGSAVYVDFSQKSASFKILINGQSALNGVGVSNNCTYNGPISLSTASEIQILVDGMISGESQGTADSDWFFEFNSFLVTEKSSASKVTGATRSTGVRVIGGLLLAVVLFV